MESKFNYGRKGMITGDTIVAFLIITFTALYIYLNHY